MLAEIIGWTSAIILLITIGRQVYTEWLARSSRGLSKWLFVGQLTASAGFIVYSWLKNDWVFVITNLLLFITAAIGQLIYLRNKKYHSG